MKRKRDDNLGMTRRSFPLAAASFAQALACLSIEAGELAPDPWPKTDLLEPAALAKALNTAGAKPVILCVAFPVLYRQKHIIHAEFAGPTGKQEGIDALRAAAAKLPKDSDIVIYCGCCPMIRCPNVRPAYRELRQLGYHNVRVLNIPTNFHDDWVAKNYPVEEALGVPNRVQPLTEK